MRDRPAVVVPPLDLARAFFIVEVAEGGAPTHAQALDLLDGHPSAQWIVLRWWRDGIRLQSALRRDAFRKLVVAPLEDRPLAVTLRIAPPPDAGTLSMHQYRHSDRRGALVVDDDVLLGVTEPWPGGTRGEEPLREDAGTGADKEFPHRLDALMPARIHAGTVATLVVTLDRIEHAPACAGDIFLTQGEPLEITVQGDSRLQPMGENSLALAVPAGSDTAAIRFAFTALSSGPASVKVFAFRGGVSVGRLVLGVEVLLRHKSIEGVAVARQEMPIAASTCVPPDLRLLVIEGHDSLRFQLWIGQRKERDFPDVVCKDLGQYMRQFVEAIEGLEIGRPESAEVAHRKLRAWGANLFDSLVPAPLQRLLWAQREQSTLTLQVCSDDAWIPWEACRLLGRDEDGRVEEGPFFAEAFAMTRWLHGMPAPATFRMSCCALVVPQDSALETAASERTYYLGLARDGREVSEVPAHYLSLTRAMESGRFDAWHFCGHANAGTVRQGDRASLRLEGNETMSADLFAGTVENALIPRPFIFFNACQSALGGQAVTGVGGWAHRFVRPNLERHGAAVFVGTYWSVYDAAAHRFATALYDGLMKGVAIGAAARAARSEARLSKRGEAPADPLSWLAYTVYADPLATMEAN